MAVEYRLGMKKNHDFRPMSRFISEMMPFLMTLSDL